MTRRVAVIGAGIAGLTCARRLALAGCEVQVFDKARGPGGRIPTRRRQGLAFDHGAPFFSARSEAFKAEVEAWAHAGAVASWKPRRVAIDASGVRPVASQDVWVGQPRMSAVGRHLCTELDVHLECRVARVEGRARDWTVHEVNGEAHAGFDAVVSTVPPAQASELLAGAVEAGRLDALFRLPPLEPRWSLMLALEDAFDPGFDVADFDHDVLERAICNDAKPGREKAPTWVVHAAPEWSRRHLEVRPALVAVEVETALRDAVPGFPPTIFRDIHRWRYALARKPRSPGPLEMAPGLMLGGDWTRGPELEDAFTSGCELAAAVLEGPCAIRSREDAKPLQAAQPTSTTNEMENPE